MKLMPANAFLTRTWGVAPASARPRRGPAEYQRGSRGGAATRRHDVSKRWRREPAPLPSADRPQGARYRANRCIAPLARTRRRRGYSGGEWSRRRRDDVARSARYRVNRRIARRLARTRRAAPRSARAPRLALRRARRREVGLDDERLGGAGLADDGRLRAKVCHSCDGARGARVVLVDEARPRCCEWVADAANVLSLWPGQRVHGATPACDEVHEELACF